MAERPKTVGEYLLNVPEWQLFQIALFVGLPPFVVQGSKDLPPPDNFIVTCHEREKGPDGEPCYCDLENDREQCKRPVWKQATVKKWAEDRKLIFAARLARPWWDN